MSEQTYPPGAQWSNRLASLSRLLMLGFGALILAAWLYHSPTLMLLSFASFVVCLEVTRTTKMRALEALSEQRLKARAAEIRESGQRLQGIVDSAMDAIITIDEKQNIVYLNPAAERTFRYTSSEILGQPLNLLIPERFHERHRAHVHRFSATNESRRKAGNVGQLSGRRGDGSEFPIEASISGTEVLGKKLFTAIVRDITERIEAEKERIKQSGTLQLILDSMQEGLVAADEHGTFLMWNRAATRLMGRGPDDVAIENWARHYGVYSSDGTTQLSADELPLLRAMRGENVSTEIVVRNQNFLRDCRSMFPAGL